MTMTKMERAQVRQRLLELSVSGRLRPDDVIDDARDEGSPLHSHFEWDDAVAGHQHRLYQARQLIATVKTVVESKGRLVKVREFIKDPDTEERQQGYTRVALIRDNDAMAHAALVNEARRVESGLRRAIDIATALDRVGELRDILEKVRVYREYLEGAA